MMTRYDPSVNTLRGTVACFAAGVAGADAVTVLPFDEFVGEAVSERGRRLARNTQSVLAMESHLASVVDPAGGSWYVERRTDEVAAAAWATFQEVERTGGFRAAVVAGVVDEALATTRAARQGDLDHRRRPITGVSEFPNIAEPPAPSWPNRPTAARGADGLAEGVSGVHCGKLPRWRWAEGFESLRQRVDAATGTGERPIVMLATLGRPAAFTARAMFAQNFFAVAGVGTRSGPISDNVVEVANAFTEALGAGAGAVCICSSDAVYAEQGAALAKALTAAGASRVYLVGPPGDQLGELREAGVTHTIAAGDDARAALTDLVDHLGIP
jgi:methylmalonyl-CoA mutase